MEEPDSHIYEQKDAIATITFNRPERRNATNAKFYEDFLAHLDTADADPSVRLVVIAAAGPVFCAGQDLKMSTGPTPANMEQFQRYSTAAHASWERIRNFTKPVIARVHGDALGGGMYIATHCDLIAATKNARFAMREINAGEQSGGMHLLTVGKQRAMEITLLGRYFYASEAAEWGLINKCLDDEEALDEQIADWARQICALPPLGVAESKRAANFMLDLAGFKLHMTAPFGKTLRYTEDRLEAKRSWAEKREPVYKGR